MYQKFLGLIKILFCQFDMRPNKGDYIDILLGRFLLLSSFYNDVSFDGLLKAYPDNEVTNIHLKMWQKLYFFITIGFSLLIIIPKRTNFCKGSIFFLLRPTFRILGVLKYHNSFYDYAFDHIY